ncbi:acyl-CoA dehydrogenase [Duganella sp. FT92W]|uniref:Acyl-CoA dehydrogenase n=1 Tax=Pseudoduganella rivuli TaxID=2666085 RepID=A0A7X2IMA6_9BURK|nr:acyl-CoA dehydrogenase family protein [Pseudoduganella rivuli]MRV72083.1 acyl-CoA dehydrogenase [Pseudoduganella rivuli]
MDFTFAEDQVLLADTVRRFLVNEVSPELIRELWNRPGGRSQDLWMQLAQQGLTGLSVPAEHGGMGMSDVDWVLLARECGYHGLPAPLLESSWVAAGLLAQLPQGDVRDHALAGIADGSLRVAMGHAHSPLVADADQANLVLLERDGRLFAVPSSRIAMTAQPSIDPSRRLFTVQWDSEPQYCIVEQAHGLMEQAFQRGALAAAAQLLGLAQRMLDLAIDYADQRKQFGKPIGVNQAIKHHLADVAVKLEFARPVVFRAAHALAHSTPDSAAQCAVHVSHAKVAASEAALLAARNAMQVHGAMGYTWEMDLQIFMKMAWALDAAWGERTLHLARVRAHVLARDAALGPGSTFGEEQP